MLVVACLVFQVMAQDLYNTSPIGDEVKKAFQNEDLFNTSLRTGMSPNATAIGVRTPVIQVRTLVVGGTWSLSLQDTSSSTILLNLTQYQDAIFGSGEIIKDGKTIKAVVGGTIIGDKLALYIMPEASTNLYRMSLTARPGSMSGSYLFTAPGITQPGIAFGSQTAPPRASMVGL